MKAGEEFEIRCYEYLKKLYKTKETDFCHKGGMDSTKSDIAVLKNGKVSFFIEVKERLAQSGQFVLSPKEDMETFIFSPKNKSEPNEMTDIIIDYMNGDFWNFNRAGTTGKSLNINPNIFADWIVGYYKEKGVKYVISFDKDYVIFPIRRFQEYFNIIAKYRIKKSGSRVPAKKDMETIKKCIKEYYHTAQFIQKEKRIYLQLDESLTKEKFSLGEYTYYLSERSSNEYEIRKLSNTYHMNVIFSIKLIKKQDKMDLSEFEEELLN